MLKTKLLMNLQKVSKTQLTNFPSMPTVCTHARTCFAQCCWLLKKTWRCKLRYMWEPYMGTTTLYEQITQSRSRSRGVYFSNASQWRKWTTNPNPPSLRIPAQAPQRALVLEARSPSTDSKKPLSPSTPTNPDRQTDTKNTSCTDHAYRWTWVKPWK